MQTAKTIKARGETFLDAKRDLNRRLDIYDIALQGLYDVAQDLRLAIIDASGTNSGLALREKINDFYDTAVSLLNTKDGGDFVFGGTRTDTQPVAVTTTTALSALGLGNHANGFRQQLVSWTRFPWTQNWLNRSVQGGPEHDR